MFSTKEQFAVRLGEMTRKRNLTGSENGPGSGSMWIAFPGVNGCNLERAARSGAQTLDVLDNEACRIRFAVAIEKASVRGAAPDGEAGDGFVILRIAIMKL